MSLIKPKLLLLAGTSEAKALATLLSSSRKLDVIASLHQDARLPRDLDVPTRFGAFEDIHEFRDFILHEKVSGILDVSHPFSVDVSQQAFALSKEFNLPLMRLERAAWIPSKEDNWTFVDDEVDVHNYLEDCLKIMTFTGRVSIGKFSNIENSYIYNRILQNTDEDFPLPNGEHVFGWPPFTIADEVELFQRLEIDAIVLRNVGGKNGFSKLEAARRLGIKVIMINRPTVKAPKPLANLKAALSWIDRTYARTYH